MTHRLGVRVLATPLAVVRLAPTDSIPAWAAQGQLFSITRTSDELSVVCAEQLAPEGARVERGFRALMLEGPFAFTMSGVLASVLAPLAAAEIPVFALSTFDTDYVLVKGERLARAVEVLRAAGHRVG